MKKIMAFILVAVVAVSMLGMMGSARLDETIVQKEKAHEIAELARSLGLAEEDPIIERARELWWEADKEYISSRDIVAVVVYNEAWSGTTQRHKELVAAVVANRVKSNRFPSTVYDVVAAPKQYLKSYATPGSTEWNAAHADPEIWRQCVGVADKAMRGEVECPEDVLFQAEFIQGLGVYEICTTNYSTTYFCYG